MHLKSSVPEFTQTLEREVLPLLRKTEGIPGRKSTFVAPGGKEAFGISLWDQRNAESYNAELTPKWPKALAKGLTELLR